MSEQLSGNPEENNIEADPLYHDVSEKLLTAWGTSTDELGSANIYRTAEYLYYSLYDPEEFARRGVGQSERYPDRLPTLQKELPSRPEIVPEERVFIERVRHALTRETNYKEALYPETPAALRAMMETGPTIIWTAGDMVGFPERDIPGSKQQLQKIVLSEFNELRREVAEQKNLPPNEVMRVAAAEDKLALLPEIFDGLKERDRQHITILEDRLHNLVAATELGRENGFHVSPVWVREPRHGHKIPSGMTEKDLEQYLIIQNIGEIIQPLKTNAPEQTAFLCDYDGVLSDHQKRILEQNKAVVRALRAQRWL